MNKFTLKASLFLCAGMFTVTANAQQSTAKKFGKLPAIVKSEPCGTMQYEELLKKQNPARNDKEQFEQWIAPKVADARLKRFQKDNNAVVTIPVVFHIIHNGDAIGENENLAEAQILSQIDVLNQDFRRQEGTNGYNTNSVGADMEIEFCMARQDPNGQPSSGIVRYNLGDDNGWSMEEVELIKAQTQWDPNKYLNIWVLDEIYSLAGYAQFPTGSGLDGLAGQTSTANTDGVALGHIYVGSEEIYPEGTYDETRNLGRTATHEVGHYFGLRHIWGDEGVCGATDYCDDTPFSLSATLGCPTGADTCPTFPGIDMIENYMDYTYDTCLNIFTQDQKDRMQAVLANSPRRKTLPTANSCALGTASIDNDGALYIIPFSTDCSNAYSPEIVLRNVGSNAITSATITYNLDNATATTYNWSGSLLSGEDVRIMLPAGGASEGDHVFTASLQSVNGVADTMTANNTKTNEFYFEQFDDYDTETVTVTVQTDDAASEVIWYISDSAQNIIAFGGGYEDTPGGVLDVQEVPVDSNTCYAFIIIDQGQDGIPNGYYSITTDSGEVIHEGQGDEIEFIDLAAFGVNVVLGTNPAEAFTKTVLYPNPANNIINIATSDNDLPESYTVYNSLGQVMGVGTINAAIETIDIAKYANGVYFVKLAKGTESKTLQFIKY